MKPRTEEMMRKTSLSQELENVRPTQAETENETVMQINVATQYHVPTCFHPCCQLASAPYALSRMATQLVASLIAKTAEHITKHRTAHAFPRKNRPSPCMKTGHGSRRGGPLVGFGRRARRV